MKIENFVRNSVFKLSLLRLSVFASLAILAMVLVTVFLPQIVAGHTCCDGCGDCTYGACDSCRDDNCCEEESECDQLIGEVVPTKPSTKFERETVYTNVKIRNRDDKPHYYDIYAYLCESGCSTSCDSCSSCDYTDCKQMVCDSTHVFVAAGETKYVKCARFVSESGYYRIRVEYKADCVTEKTTVYSEKFEVVDRYDDCCRCGTCDCDTGDYRCFGNFLQKRYRDENCDWRWKVVEYCSYGCENDRCVAPKPASTPQSLGEPKIFMPTSYVMDKCKLSSLTFTIQNKGKLDTFKFGVQGDAAAWIDMPILVEIGEGEVKHITAYASIPCEASSGLHEFTITATGKTSDSRIGAISIKEPTGIFVLSPITDLLLVLVVVFVFVLALWYREKFSFEHPTFRKKPDYKEPEEFKTKISFKQKVLKNFKINEKGD